MASTDGSRTPGPGRRRKGFERASGLVEQRIRRAGESRGFAVARLLTHWAEIVGEEVAAVSRPVSVGYGRDGIGATLTVLTTGAHGPMLQMQEPRLREKVNACYGYRAISRIRFTQSAPTGFAEGQATFGPAPKPARAEPDPAAAARASTLADGIADPGLRAALARLGGHILTKSTGSTETTT